MLMTSLIGNRAGQKLGNYQLKRIIGQGAFAEVYLAEHVYLKRQVAVKVLHSQLAKEDQESFLNEARTIARLQHPNILSVLEFGVEEGIPFLVMDYAPRGSLRERFPRHAHPTPLAVLPFIKQAAAALQYAHQENIVHRDVKPENMLLSAQDELLLSDFGMSLGIQSSRSQSMDDIAGTIAYMAPEQLRGVPVAASDQYSLGIVLYEWLSGDCPFHGSFSETASQQVMAAPPPIKSPAVSPEVEAVIQQALAKTPEQRFASVQAFADAFEQATLEVEGTLRAPEGWWPPGVYQQLPTTGSIDGQLTLRESSSPIAGQFSTPQLPPLEPPIGPSKKARKMPARGLAIGLIVLALLVVISGITYLSFNAGQPGTQQQDQTSVQIGGAAAAWQGRYKQVVSEKPLFADTLSQNMNKWDSGVNSVLSCLFKSGGYHVISRRLYSPNWCFTDPPRRFNNFAYQVQMTIVQGNEGGVVFGLTLTAAKQPAHCYFFSLNRNGTYTLWMLINTQYKILLHRPNAVIKTGLNQPNQLTVLTQGNQIALFINKQYVVSVLTNAPASGIVGLFATNLPDTTDIAFSNLEIWKL